MNQLISTSYYDSKTTTPNFRSGKEGWLNTHQRHNIAVKSPKAKHILIGDSIVKNLSFYRNIWQTFFTNQQYINCGIGGDCTQNVLWRADNLDLSSSVESVFIHCGTNNLGKNLPIEIANGIISIGIYFAKTYPNIKVFLSGLLPRESANSNKRVSLEYVNHHVELFCKNNAGFHYVDNGEDWKNKDGSLREDLFFKDKLHLIEKGNVLLSKIILKSIHSVHPKVKNICPQIKKCVNYEEEYPSIGERSEKLNGKPFSSLNLDLDNFPFLPSNQPSTTISTSLCTSLSFSKSSCRA